MAGADDALGWPVVPTCSTSTQGPVLVVDAELGGRLGADQLFVVEDLDALGVRTLALSSMTTTWRTVRNVGINGARPSGERSTKMSDPARRLTM